MLGDSLLYFAQRSHRTVGVPQAMPADLLRTWTVCNIVDVVLTLVHWHNELFIRLRDEFRRGLSRRVFLVVLVLQQPAAERKVFCQALDVRLLLFRWRRVRVLLWNHHTFACSEIVCAVTQPFCILLALEVGRDEDQSCQSSSSPNRRWVSSALEKLI